MANKPDLRKAEANKVFLISSSNKDEAVKIANAIDKFENMEAQVTPLIQNELDELIQEMSIVDDEKDYKKLLLMKDNIAKTLLIQLRLAQYAGIKRGILPRAAGAGTAPPERDYSSARQLVEKYREQQQLKESVNDYSVE